MELRKPDMEECQVKHVQTLDKLVFDPVGYFLGMCCKGNLTILRRVLHLDLAKGNPKQIYIREWI
jgi:hypothetical protein